MLKLFERLFNWLEAESSLVQLWKLLLKAFAVGVPLLLLLQSIELWRSVSGTLPVRQTLAMVVVQLVLVAVGVWSFGVLWMRSNSPLAQVPGKRFPLLLLAIPGCRAIGELLAGCFAMMGFGGALSMWISGAPPASLGFFVFGARMGGNAFAGGLTSLVFGCLMALVSILAFYRMAEWVGLALSVERSVKQTAVSGLPHAGAKAP